MGSRRSHRRWRRRLLLLAVIAGLVLAAWVIARWLAASAGGFSPDAAAGARAGAPAIAAAQCTMDSPGGQPKVRPHARRGRGGSA